METPKKDTWGTFFSKAVSLVVVVAVLAVFSNWATKVNAADAAVQQRMTEAEHAANRGPFDVKDGTYQASAKGYGGPVVIAVTMKNGYIDKLEAVSHDKEDAEWWDLAKKLLETIPEKQSTNVDVVSSATYSSAGIINATRKAIKSAPKADEQ